MVHNLLANLVVFRFARVVMWWARIEDLIDDVHRTVSSNNVWNNNALTVHEEFWDEYVIFSGNREAIFELYGMNVKRTVCKKGRQS